MLISIIIEVCTMEDESKAGKQLNKELEKLRRRVAELEKEKTGLKRAAELLRQQKEEQKIIFDAVPAMIFFKDTENRFIRVNRALAEASGVTVEQMEGKSCFELFPDLADKYWKDDKEVMAAGAPKRDIIESMVTPDGVAWVKTDKIPYWDEKDNIAGVIRFCHRRYCPYEYGKYTAKTLFVSRNINRYNP